MGTTLGAMGLSLDGTEFCPFWKQGYVNVSYFRERKRVSYNIRSVS